MIFKDRKKLLREIDREYRKLESYFKISHERGRNLKRLVNLKEGFNDWAKNRRSDSYLSPAEIEYGLGAESTSISENTIAKAISRLNIIIIDYYEKVGANCLIIFRIDPFGSDGRYRLKVSIFDDDVGDHENFIIYVHKYIDKKAPEYRYILLFSAKSILKTPPPDKDFAKPKYFRKIGPIAADIEGGKIHIRKEVEEVIDALKKEEAVLLSGVAASGKTVVARVVAYNWLKEGKKVQFVRQIRGLQSADLYKLLEETANFGKEAPAPLLIFEDAHLNPGLVNRFLSKRAQGWPKVLVTSRDPIPELHSQDETHFESLNKLTLLSDDATNEIISLYFKDVERKYWALTAKLKREIKSFSKKSLWLLSYALKSLNETKGKKIHRNSILKEVRKDLNDLARINTIYPRLLIALSVLYRFEHPTDLRYLYQSFSDYQNTVIEEAMRNLVSMGEVISIHRGKYHLFGLPHSALADLYFNFAKDTEWEEDSIYGDEINFTCNYLESKKTVNGLSLFRSFDFRYQDKLNFRKIIEALDKKKLADKIQMVEKLSDIKFYILLVFKESPEAGKELWRYIDKEKLADMLLGADNFLNAVSFIKLMFQKDYGVGQELWEHMDKQNFGNILLRAFYMSSSKFLFEPLLVKNPDTGRIQWGSIDTDDVKDVAECIEQIFKINIDVGREFWEHIDKEKLASVILKYSSFSALEFLDIIYNANHEAGRELWKYMNKNGFAEILLSSNYPSDVGLIIEHIFKLNHEIGEELWRLIDKEKLAKTISNINDIEDAGYCLRSIIDAKYEAWEELWRLIDKEKLANNISNDRDIRSAVYIIDLIFKGNPMAGIEFWGHINKEKLANRITGVIDNIVANCIKVIFEANHEAGKELLGHMNKEKLSSRISRSRHISRQDKERLLGIISDIET